jgi:hypothetical protein
MGMSKRNVNVYSGYANVGTMPLSSCDTVAQAGRLANWRAWTAALGTEGGPALVIEFRDLLVG